MNSQLILNCLITLNYVCLFLFNHKWIIMINRAKLILGYNQNKIRSYLIKHISNCYISFETQWPFHHQFHETYAILDCYLAFYAYFGCQRTCKKVCFPRIMLKTFLKEEQTFNTTNKKQLKTYARAFFVKMI